MGCHLLLFTLKKASGAVIGNSHFLVPLCRSLAWLQLTGTFPAAGWELPSQLQELYLDGNFINGLLTSAWRLPATLKYLFMGGLDQSAPSTLGSIPAAWDLSQTALERLGLGACGLTGTIPTSWLQKLPASLRSLHLGQNNLEGGLAFLAYLPAAMSSFTAFDNHLGGTLPADMRLKNGLELLDLGGNSISGTIPANLVLPATTLTLGLDNNLLVGRIPQALALPASMASLSLFGNAISGAPRRMCQCMPGAPPTKGVGALWRALGCSD